ncbi:hypothetical protein CBR_g4840 [Chara braunii]|uniref:Exonuclease domain-containing protein n=1 Tax=Chara braunii TaxID=69332 RepID=A0A388KJ67_CHABU|nr:hypothetical protein CBR_g4840 [Chara braunii]|eukprot:GBG70013.1 hypothetical protein CBR_g4840 [Chara braunii]
MRPDPSIDSAPGVGMRRGSSEAMAADQHCGSFHGRQQQQQQQQQQPQSQLRDEEDEPHHQLEIAFYDMQSTVPSKKGDESEPLEFSSIILAAHGLFETDSFSSLLRPSSVSLITTVSVASNGITRDAVRDAPSFDEVADTIFNVLHGRVWAGQNISKVGNARIREAFQRANRSPPEPVAVLDTQLLLQKCFGKRAAELKFNKLNRISAEASRIRRCGS